MRSLIYPLALIVIAVAVFFIVKPGAEPDVVLYCGVDQHQSRPIASLFQEETGLAVHYESEIESQRSIGLPQKIRDEKAHPRADVFWSNEIMNMVDLSLRDLIAPLPPGVADAFPDAWRDPAGRYVAFGARARILLVNTELLPNREDWPTSVHDLLDPDGTYAAMGLHTCMARPLTGTTYTHAVALLSKDETAGTAFLESVVAASEQGLLKLVQSNGRAMRQARESENKVAFCLTDTDDAWKAIEQGFPVEVVYPDQGEGEPGAVLIPNTIGLVKGHPHAENAAKLLAWLVSAENEVRLAEGPSAQIPLRTDLGGATLPAHVKRPGADFRAMEVDWQKVGESRDVWADFLNAKFRSVD